MGKVLLLLALLAPGVSAQTAAGRKPALTRRNVAQLLSFDTSTGDVLSDEWFVSPAGSVRIDHETAHSGSASVLLQRDASSAGPVSILGANIPVDFTGARIELRGYLKVDGVKQFAGLWLREDDAAGMLALDNMQEQRVRGTLDWKQYTVSLHLNPEARMLHFGVLLPGSGKVWAANLELLVDGKPVSQAPAPSLTVLDCDHEFDHSSRIVLARLTPLQIDNLATLARVWGFLKYHHPLVTAGRLHWDYELFRILPRILAARSRGRANDVLVQWIDSLGNVSACSPCAQPPGPDTQLAPDIGWIRDTRLLGAPLSARLQHIYANRPTQKQFFVSWAPVVGNPVFEHEPVYADAHLPDSGFQLLALFRFWNMVQYWYPYREVAGQRWPDVLREFIPRVALTKDRTAFELAMLAFTATINDTHVNLSSSISVRPPVGACRLPVNLRFVEGKAVVVSSASSIAQTDAKLAAGDVVVSLDGRAIQKLIADWLPLYADSNQAARQRDMARALSNGSCGPVEVDVLRGNASVHVTTERVPASKLDAVSYTHDLPGPTFRLISPDIAYLKLSSIHAADVAGYIRSAHGTRGLIVDIRNYPSEFVPFALGSLLVTKRTDFARFTRAQPSNPGAFVWQDGDKIEPGEPHYTGKVVVLVDEDSQSQAEYTAMALRAAPNAILVGSQTAGADGNVSVIPLPGGLRSGISGIGVFYPDKRPTQRAGVRIDVAVEPTIAGIRSGRDEVLEEAVRQIEGGH